MTKSAARSKNDSTTAVEETGQWCGNQNMWSLAYHGVMKCYRTLPKFLAHKKVKIRTQHTKIQTLLTSWIMFFHLSAALQLDHFYSRLPTWDIIYHNAKQPHHNQIVFLTVSHTYPPPVSRWCLQTFQWFPAAKPRIFSQTPKLQVGISQSFLSSALKKWIEGGFSLMLTRIYS